MQYKRDRRHKIEDGLVKTLKSIRYVLDLEKNLISLGELDKSDHSYKRHDGILRVSNGALICMKVALHNGIYVLQTTTLSG